MVLNIDDNRVALTITPLFRLAFRPLFLGGTLFSMLAIALWTQFWLFPFDWQPHGGVLWWHGHEMIFGFGAAIIVGFLLTAVQTWTGVIGLRGKPLVLLASLWLLGRCVLGFELGIPPLLIAFADCSFLLMATIAMAYPIFKARQWGNLMFVPILAVFTILNAGSHYGALTQQPELALKTLHASIMLITLIISIVGGRVIPFFTANATGATRKPNYKWLEVLSILSTISLVVCAGFGFSSVAPGILFTLAGIGALANAFRFLRWGFQHCWQVPLLWSLHLAYVFVPLGMFALALYGAGVITNLSTALHCFTVGAMGGMILAMISRVTLGHTGRPLKAPGGIYFAFIAILLAAACRVVLPELFPGISRWGIGIAGVLWLVAYGIYGFCYSPMLVSTRADGRPG